jgi:hypothetical protein
LFPPGASDRAVPLTPLSLPGHCRRAVARRASPGCLGRFLRPSVKMRRSVRPEMPSAAGGRPRARVSRFRFRDAVTCVSATNPALATSSPAAPTVPLSLHRRLLRARSPSLPTARLAMFTRDAGERFSGSGGRPTTSATSLPTHGHTLEHPFLARPERPASAVTPDLSSLPPRFLRRDGPPLSRKDREGCEP